MSERGSMQQKTPTMDLSALVAGRSPTEQERRIWGTRTGLRVLVLAVLLQWIPLIEYLGLMVGAIGVLYVIRGRRAFGLRHERLVWASVVLFAATELAAFALDQEFGYALSVARYSYSGPDAASVATAAFDGLAVGSSAVAVFLAVSYVLLVFDLEDRDGRRWLLAGLVAQGVASTLVCVGILLPFVQQSVPQAYLTNPPDPVILAAADAQIRGLSALRLVDLIPAILIAWAYRWAVLRIDRGDLPSGHFRGPSTGPS